MKPDEATGRLETIGARLEVEPLLHRRLAAAGQPNHEIDVSQDRAGEFFQLRAGEAVQVEVLQVAPALRHLRNERFRFSVAYLD